MEYNIRPLSFAEILDRSFRVLVDNAVLLIGISAPFGIVESALKGPGTWYVAAFFLIAMVGGALVQAALTCAVADTYQGKAVTIASAYKSAWSIIFPIVGTYLLIYALFAVAGGVW